MNANTSVREPPTKDRFIALVRADLWRCAGKTGLVAFAKTWFLDPAARPVFTLRLVQALRAKKSWWRKVLLPWGLLWHRATQARCGVDLPTSVHMARGFKLLHGWGVVINGDSQIGSNVTIMQGVTIGGARTGVPRIEDDVIICANACVIGGITVGHGAVIGAGCVVVRDVPPNATVVGNPQREIPRRDAPRGFNSLPDSLRA